MNRTRGGALLLPDAATSGVASSVAILRAGLWTLLAAHMVAIWGAQWDVQWHLLIGRDSFWIAPHLMTYSGVVAIVLVSFGVLGWMSWHGADGFESIRLIGITGTRGYHLAALGIGLTVLAAPIDDLWHRTFGLDVTIWSPPHLLGLLGAIVSAAGCWLIALETYPAGSRSRSVALVLAGAIVYGGLSFALQPAIQVAYLHGGVRFFTSPMLAALMLPLPLIVTAHLSRLRAAPALVFVAVFTIALAGAGIARAGFAWLQPESFIAEEIAKDPTSPIALAHEIAARNMARPGGFSPNARVHPLLVALVMVIIDPRRRPVLASVAYGLTILLTSGVVLARLPAFAASLPSASDTVLAAGLTILAAMVGATVAGGVAKLLRRVGLVSHAS
jgi:hypothetical protein